MLRRSVIAWLVVGVALAYVCPVAHAQPALSPCTSNCAQVSVGGASGVTGATVALPVSFKQGPTVGQPEQGNDDVAAIAMTIGLGPSDAPLRFTDAGCQDNDQDGLPDAVTVSDSIKTDFRVVVENVCCTGRQRCLCPKVGDLCTTAGTTRDNFVNVVVYGPKDLPPDGPVNIPKLPPDGELFTVRVQIPGTTADSIPVHVFAETDDEAQMPKPQFGAFLSIGDQSAVDETADRGAKVSKVAVTSAAVAVTGSGCIGDCDENLSVSVDELVLGVRIALGQSNVTSCPAIDLDHNNTVAINDLVSAVNNALDGCQ